MINELREVSNWFRANKLSVNAGKTNYMILGTRNGTSGYVDVNEQGNIKKHNVNSNKKVNIVLDDVSLEKVNRTKFLGVVIDENLTWKCHIDAISKTISRNIGVLNKLKHFVPDNILHTLYCTLIIR